MDQPNRRLAAFTTVLACILLSIQTLYAQQNVTVKIGAATVELAAVTDSAFRLTVSYSAHPTPTPSIFLAPNLTAPASTVFNENGWIGVKIAAAELLIDPATGLWKLLDAQGKTLIPPAPVSEATRNAQTGDPFVVVNVGCPTGRSFKVYGPGNGDGQLLQDNARPRVGNGLAVVPFYWSPSGYAALGVSENDNSPPSWSASSDLGRVSWVYKGTSADLYLMPAATLDAATRAFGDLSGRPVVPPRWTFGYLQSRWGWKDRAYIEDTLHQFISRKLPVDAFIFDFEWYAKSPDYELGPAGSPDFKDFSFNPTLFPDPAAQIAAMKSSGVRFVGIRKPRLGNSDLIKMARSKNWILSQGKSGENIDSRCLDFSNADVRAWYVDQTVPLLKQGIDGWWDDEGEITYSQYYWWNQAEADALAHVNPTARLWTIDRAFAPGAQREGAAAWTGDIRATWKDFADTPTNLLNWSLAGMPYGACDIGGFSGETNARLLTRWMEAGVFFPVMRAHSVVNATPHFPWLFGDEAESAIRKALDLRYQLIPYIYSLAHHAHETGVPIMRPLAQEFPGDWRCENLSDEWLLGKNVLAAPVLDASDQRHVYLPAGTWFALGSGKPISGEQNLDVPAKLDEIPVYVRAGTVLPLGPVIQHTADLPGGPLEVQIYPGKDGKITLTEDDGISTAYLKGMIRQTNFAWNNAARTLSWTITGPYAGSDIFKEIKISVMDPDGVKYATGSITTDGQQVIP